MHNDCLSVCSRMGVCVRKNKYHAKRTLVNGVMCDSKLEAKHYDGLLKLERAGHIKDLILHPKFTAYVNGLKIGAVVLDFQFYDIRQAKTRYIDSKGVYTAYSKWKHKHIMAQEGITIEIWTKDKWG